MHKDIIKEICRKLLLHCETNIAKTQHDDNKFYCIDAFPNTASKHDEAILFFINDILNGNTSWLDSSAFTVYNWNSNPWNPGRAVTNSDYLEKVNCQTTGDFIDFFERLGAGIYSFSDTDNQYEYEIHVVYEEERKKTANDKENKEDKEEKEKRIIILDIAYLQEKINNL